MSDAERAALGRAAGQGNVGAAVTLLGLLQREEAARGCASGRSPGRRS